MDTWGKLGRTAYFWFVIVAVSAILVGWAVASERLAVAIIEGVSEFDPIVGFGVGLAMLFASVVVSFLYGSGPDSERVDPNLVLDYEDDLATAGRRPFLTLREVWALVRHPFI